MSNSAISADEKYTFYLNKMKENYTKLYNFVEESSKNFPEQSHGIEHADCVYKLTMKIAVIESTIHNIELTDDILTILQAAAMCHDVIDNKYKSVCIEQSDLIKWLSENINENYTNRIIKIIDNISYSKQMDPKRGREVLSSPDKEILNWISDADRLEAIGLRGIERCITYNTYKYKDKGMDSAIKYIRGTLMRYSENALDSKTAKEMAIKLDEEMKFYINKIDTDEQY